MFIQQLISGIAAGFIYALLGLAITLVFKATDTINFAVGDMMMFSAFIAYTLLKIVKPPYYQVKPTSDGDTWTPLPGPRWHA